MVKEFEIPWAAWREPKTLKLTFPDSWDVSMCRMKGADAPELADKEIKEAILNPIGSPSLSELALGKEKIVIVVDDLTRTTPADKILPHVIEELEKVSINKEQVSILFALGAHRPMNRNDSILKLGKEIVETINIENHHPYENLINLGESKIGTPIDINATYYNADLKIAIGGVIPHPLAGFGGGAKIVLPGVSGIRTLEANHDAALRGVGAGIGRLTGVREDIEEIAEKVGLDFSINVIFTENGGISGITAGHFREAHRKAMELAKNAYSTVLTRNNQVCFLNAYPEDSELNQAVKGLNILMTAPKPFSDRKGCFVLMTSSHEGRGFHSLLWETGAKLYCNLGESMLWKAFIKKKQVLVYSPNISESDLYHIFPKSVKLFKNWNDLIEELSKVYGESPRAAIIPTSIQLS